jgi:hypothetical protein
LFISNENNEKFDRKMDYTSKQQKMLAGTWQTLSGDIWFGNLKKQLNNE